ncbi:MAG: hypothetical protein WEA34_03610 [Gemmatimonadota bacterium]
MSRIGPRLRHIARRRLFMGLLLTSVTACADGVDRESSAEPDRWTTNPEPALSVGEVDGDPRHLFSQITGVSLFPDGAFAVSEFSSRTIRVYDAEGRYVVSMGGPGEGPGEFGDINHLSVLPPDTLLAYDVSTLRLTRYLRDGTLLGTTSIEPAGGWPEVVLGTYADGGVAVASLVPSPRGGTEIVPDRMVIGRYASDGSLVAVVDTVTGIRRAGGTAVVPFSPFMHAWLLGDSVYVTDGTEPVVDVLDAEGRTIRQIRVSISRLDLDAAWRVLRAELAARDRTQWIEDLAPGVTEEPVPVIATSMVDRDERIWLKHYEPATDATHLRGGAMAGGRWTLVEADGRIVAEVELPDGFAPMDATGRSVLGIHRDELGVERVRVYDLVG